MIKLEFIKNENNHYYTVMGWEDNSKTNAPKASRKFDIFDDAKKFYKKISKSCAYCEIKEVIDKKRKLIAYTGNDKKLESYC